MEMPNFVISCVVSHSSPFFVQVSTKFQRCFFVYW